MGTPITLKTHDNGRNELRVPGFSQADIAIIAQVNTLCAVGKLNQADVAKEMDLAPSTMSMRMNNPATFRVMELRILARLCAKYGVSIANPVALDPNH